MKLQIKFEIKFQIKILEKAERAERLTERD